MKLVKRLIAIAAICTFFLATTVILDAETSREELTIFYAAGLNAYLKEAIREFKKIHPSVEIIAESSASLLAVRKITELNRKTDLLLLADGLIIQNMLIPKYTDWYVRFYKDEIVIAYTDKSKYTNEINEKNWYKILLRRDVRYAYANPNLAPIGYRTLMCWQLADIYYQDKIDNKNISQALKDNCSKQYIMPDVFEMLYILESFYLDYAFVYESTAKQHNLKYIHLPKEINLGSPDLADFYKQAKVEIFTKARSESSIVFGGPITFTITILKDASNFRQAVEFAKFLLGPQGRKILERNDQQPLKPYEVFNLDAVPDELKKFIFSAPPS